MSRNILAYDFSLLPQFEYALDNFFREYQQLYGSLEYNYGKCKLFDQLLANGNDVFQFSLRILRRTLFEYQRVLNFDILSSLDLLENKNSLEYIENYIQEHGKLPPREKLDFKKAWRRTKRKMRRVAELSQTLGASYKAFFYFVRSYQDINYKVLLLLTGQRYGEFSSIAQILDEENKCFRQKNSVGRILAASFPEYVGWFLEFREMRNAIKTGILTGAKLVEADPSIVFVRLGKLGYETDRTFSVCDLIEAIDKTTKLTQITYRNIKQKDG
jgi:hypothetical protein